MDQQKIKNNNKKAHERNQLDPFPYPSLPTWTQRNRWLFPVSALLWKVYTSLMHGCGASVMNDGRRSCTEHGWTGAGSGRGVGCGCSATSKALSLGCATLIGCFAEAFLGVRVQMCPCAGEAPGATSLSRIQPRPTSLLAPAQVRIAPSVTMHYQDENNQTPLTTQVAIFAI